MAKVKAADRRNVTLSFRVSANEVDKIEGAADEVEDGNTSEFVRVAVLHRADRVLKRQQKGD